MGRHVVTGAFGYSGKRIATRLLEAGHTVHTLTNSPDRPDPFGGAVTASRYRFDDPAALARSLEGTDVLHNTYWVRFNRRGRFSHGEAVRNTRSLFGAAKEAGVGRIVHVSITNPSEESDLEYFRGKAELERALRETGLSFSILRPAVIFGGEDILLNNIAWALRKLPVFGVFGDGSYRLQPIHVDDFAAMAMKESGAGEDRVVDAIGPETYTYRELVSTLGEAIGKCRPIVSVPPWFGRGVAALLGTVLGDVFLTRDEIDGLMRGLLATESEPAGTTRLSEWARAQAAHLGVRYRSELARRRHRDRAYEEL